MSDEKTSETVTVTAELMQTTAVEVGDLLLKKLPNAVAAYAVIVYLKMTLEHRLEQSKTPSSETLKAIEWAAEMTKVSIENEEEEEAWEEKEEGGKIVKPSGVH